MKMEPIQVQARWKRNGGFEPTQFMLQGKLYRVESTGRDWEDESGYHVLCMIAGGQVFELLFHLNPAGWMARSLANGPKVA
jgi:hypothetical protein